MTNYFFQKKILIAPLDWGLGHATRCIPVIALLQKRGCEIIFAGSGVQLMLIKKEFPGIAMVEIKGYNISYTRSKRWFSFKILLQAPKIFLSIRREKRILQELIIKHKPDLVISDNRYGFCNTTIPCVFMTHQLNIIAPYKWLEKLVQRINYSYINRFNQCWVPDYEGSENIAGRLSHPEELPSIPVKYLGPLSRFAYSEVENYTYKFLFLISGPEPQRSLLEEKVLSIADSLNDKVLIVRGKPNDDTKVAAGINCTIFNHLETAAQQEKIATSEYVISRSGYTTVMEILSMRKKSLLIPTPGQTEQEYLAGYLSGQHCCQACSQDDDLLKVLKQLEQFEYKLPEAKDSIFEKPITEALEQLFSNRK